MDWDAVFDLMKAVLDDEWSETPIAYQNEDFVQVYGTPWIYAELLPIDGDAPHFNSPGLSFGSGVGLIACTVFVPTGTGVRDAFRIAKLIARVIRLRTLGTGIETGAATVAGAGTDDDEGSWFRVSATAPVYINATI
jgi:hypothetical protein